MSELWEVTLARRRPLDASFYWPRHFTDEFVIGARLCNAEDATHQRKGTFQVGYPMQMVAMDILGPLPESDSGNSYLLVASDYFTRWVEVYAIPNQEALTVAKKLVDEMFCRFSPPEQLHSDQGRQFES